MMAVNTILDVTVLAIGTGVQACQKGNGIYLVLRRLVLMLEAASIPFGTGTAEIVVVAKLVAVLPLFDAIQRSL